MPAYNTATAEIEQIGQKLIATRPELELLKMCKIAFIFKEKAQVSGDRMVIGMCIRVDDRNWTLTKNDFIIWIAQDVWEDPRTTQDYKTALVHHELMHARVRLDKEGQPSFDGKGWHGYS